MKRIFAFIQISSIFGVLLLMGCAPSVPGKYIQPGEMEDILYDYHIAEAMANDYESRRDTLLMRVYKAAVLKKHGYSEAEFDSSMVYYMRHADRLHHIYESLAKRLENKSVALGGAANDFSKYSSSSLSGDTANVWTGDATFVLMPVSAFNTYSFNVKVDSSYHAGDKLLLNFDTQFIYQDGMRNGVALFAVKLKNDSVISRNVHMSGSSHYSVEIADVDRVGIKEVKGYFILNRSYNASAESQTTLKLMIVNHISLVCIHTKEPEKVPEKDTVAVQRADTVLPPNRQIPVRPIVEPLKQN
jgi:hypothetical protein